MIQTEFDKIYISLHRYVQHNLQSMRSAGRKFGVNTPEYTKELDKHTKTMKKLYLAPELTVSQRHIVKHQIRAFKAVCQNYTKEELLKLI